MIMKYFCMISLFAIAQAPSFFDIFRAKLAKPARPEFCNDTAQVYVKSSLLFLLRVVMINRLQLNSMIAPHPLHVSLYCLMSTAPAMNVKNGRVSAIALVDFFSQREKRHNTFHTKCESNISFDDENASLVLSSSFQYRLCTSIACLTFCI